ncbi:MAG: glycosyltransferase [Pseudomonadota bacterium]|nr:glycosyltransferase [Pseudomonadota bacterium]
MRSLSVVIPLYNEERRLAEGFAGVAALRARVGFPVEVVWVDDGSGDDTLHALKLAVEAGDLLLAEPHRGKGGAVRAGVARTTGDRVLLVDVDWSVPAAEVEALLAVDADLVVATREGRGARRVGEPAWRHWTGRAFNHLVQRAVLPGLEDTQCGCKLLAGPLARDLFGRMRLDGWAFDVELLALARARGCSIREVAVEWRYGADTRVRPLRDGVAMAREVWWVRRNVAAGEYR